MELLKTKMPFGSMGRKEHFLIVGRSRQEHRGVSCLQGKNGAEWD